MPGAVASGTPCILVNIVITYYKTENSLRTLMGEGMARVRKSHHTHSYRSPTDVARWSILPADISLGCYISHCTTTSCMSSSDMNLRAFFNSPQM
jgi:hypothetical protein